MKTLLKISKNTAVAIMALFISVGMMSFKMATKSNMEQWHFKAGLQLNEARLTESYEPISEDDNPSCAGLPVLPCIIEFDNNNSTTPNLGAYLSQFTSDAAVVSAAKENRSN